MLAAFEISQDHTYPYGMGFEEKCDKEFFQLKGVQVNEVCYEFWNVLYRFDGVASFNRDISHWVTSNHLICIRIRNISVERFHAVKLSRAYFFFFEYVLTG
jgi:hypothetical protein